MLNLGTIAAILSSIAAPVNNYDTPAMYTAVELIAKWEGFRGKAYQDVVGVWTIGYGHTKDVEQGDTMSQDEATIHLVAETMEYMGYVHDIEMICGYDFTENQIAALTSFTYNVGPRNLVQLTDNCERDENTIGERMVYYVNAGGVKYQGLVNRRNEERNLYFR